MAVQRSLAERSDFSPSQWDRAAAQLESEVCRVTTRRVSWARLSETGGWSVACEPLPARFAAEAVEFQEDGLSVLEYREESRELAVVVGLNRC